MYNDSLFNAFVRSFEARSETDMSMAEYLESCRGDPMRYANAAERLLAAIGEPQMIDTARDPRLGRIFLNRTMRAYPAFAGFYGMEETIERIVGFFRHAAQGLEERKQILYLLGPVGGGKSSLAERLLRPVSSGCSILIGALNISTNSRMPWLARFKPPE